MKMVDKAFGAEREFDLEVFTEIYQELSFLTKNDVKIALVSLAFYLRKMEEEGIVNLPEGVSIDIDFILSDEFEFYVADAKKGCLEKLYKRLYEGVKLL